MHKNWSTLHMPRLEGQVALVTGGNRGLGFHVALELARAGAEVILPSRDARRGAEARGRILAEVPAAKVTLGALDLGSLASVRDFASRLVAGSRPLHLLVNNAGIMSLPRRELTVDGYERQFATNHLGHFALTGLLLPLLRRASTSRVVTVSSCLAAFGRVDFDNLQSETRYSPLGAYEVSKLANQLFMRELHRRAPVGLLSVGAHPGIASTDLPQSGPAWLHKLISQPPSQGALPLLYASVGDDVGGGDYLGPSRWWGMWGPPQKARLPGRALDEAVASALWERSEALTGVSFGLEPMRPEAMPHAASASLRVSGSP